MGVTESTSSTGRKMMALSFKACTAWAKMWENYAENLVVGDVSAEFFSCLYIHAVWVLSRRMKSMAGLWQESECCESSRKQGKMHPPFRRSLWLGNLIWASLWGHASSFDQFLWLFSFLPSFFSFLLSFYPFIEKVFKLKCEVAACDDAMIHPYMEFGS